MYVYTGRFAPSPSGPLHLGSLVAAMASYLDARAHNGKWLLRIEDLDGARNVAGADRLIMAQLQALGMHWNGEPLWQSARLAAYQNAYDRLNAVGRVYGCACTRQEINDALAKRERAPKPYAKYVSRRPALPIRPYPGTCRGGLPTGRAPRSWRFKAPPVVKQFIDRWQGAQSQDVEREIGDFVIKRADGLWAYQLAVVVDDGAQGITDIVRGSDLLSSTGAQQLLAENLGIRYPRVMHVPLVHDPWGRKLSKQNHAPALDCDHPVATLNRAWQQLGFQALHANDVQAFWNLARPRWADRFEIRMAENTGSCRT